MRLALFPRRFPYNIPSKSGDVLTDYGILYWDSNLKEFYQNKGATEPLSDNVQSWYLQEEVYGVEELESEYERGYLNGLNFANELNSISSVPEY